VKKVMIDFRPLDFRPAHLGNDTQHATHRVTSVYFAFALYEEAIQIFFLFTYLSVVVT